MPDTVASTTQEERTPAAEEALSDIAQRVAELRKVSQSSSETAADAAFAWFRDLGREAAGDRGGATARLNELFRLGVPPSGIDGQTKGILVAPLISAPVDRVLRGLTSAWMPWLGKRFDAAAARGDNTLASSARWPAKLLWPRYDTRAQEGSRAAFDFETRVEPGKNDLDRDVLVIDYYPVESNPGFIIRQIRDELVEIVPGANLGKVLWRRGDDDYSLIGFFALRSPIG